MGGLHRGYRILVTFGLVAVGAVTAPPRAYSRPTDVPGSSFSEYRTVDTAISAAAAHTGARQHGLPGYLGVNVQPDAQGKLVVEDVEPQSPAATAGMQKGDVCVKLEREPVEARRSGRVAVLQRAIRRHLSEKSPAVS